MCCRLYNMRCMQAYCTYYAIMFASIHACVCVCIYVCMYVCVRACVRMCVCVHVCTRVCMRLCVGLIICEQAYLNCCYFACQYVTNVLIIVAITYWTQSSTCKFDYSGTNRKPRTYYLFIHQIGNLTPQIGSPIPRWPIQVQSNLYHYKIQKSHARSLRDKGIAFAPLDFAHWFQK